MNKKIVSLLSVMSVMFAGAAMAATVNGGPTDLKNDANYSGYYQNGTEYTGAATETNLGARYATDNSEYDLETEWTADKFQIAAGQYLASGATAGAACPAGSFCVGSTGDGFTFSATENQGIESCPAEYATSDAGAKTQSECYHAWSCPATPTCPANSVNCTYNNGSSGKTYYGTTITDNCSDISFDCAGGWHKEQFSLLETFTAKATDPSNSTSVNTSGVRNNDNTYWDEWGSKGQSYYGLTDPNTWAADFAGFGMVRGSAMCSTRARVGSGYEVVEGDGDLPGGFGTGRYCYCNITSYTDANGVEMSLSSPWVFYNTNGGASTCTDGCADDCAYNAVGNSGFRSALLGAVSTAASCSANRYKLKWQDAAGNVTETTNTVHGGSIIAPSTAPTKIGHTFRGWKLKKSAN